MITTPCTYNRGVQGVFFRGIFGIFLISLSMPDTDRLTAILTLATSVC